MRIIHLGRSFAHASKQYEDFSAKHEFFRLDPDAKTKEEVRDILRDEITTHGPFEACLSYGFHGFGTLGEDIFACTLPQLKLLTKSGAGTDVIDIEYFSKNGVYVANTPNAVTKSTADGTALLILSAIKNLNAVVAQAKSDGPWRGGLPLMGDPEDMVLGIIGMGKIGQQVALRMNAFGMKVIYHNRSRLPEDEERRVNVEYASLEQLLQRSDVLALTCPLTAGTRHIINKETLARAKSGVILVNTARGGCVDTDALIEALETGQVSTAALDVYEDEPSIPQYFKDSSKVLTTPHYLAFTKATMREIELALLENLSSYLKTKKPIYAVNAPQVK